MKSRSDGTILGALVGCELTSVVFVHDYVQLVFQPTVPAAPDPRSLRPSTTGIHGALSAFTMPQLERDGRHLRSGEAGYRDALVEQIGRRLISAEESRESLRLEFDGGVIATVSLCETDLAPGSVESAMLQLDDETRAWCVWRPGDALR